MSSGMKRGFVAMSNVRTGFPLYTNKPPPTLTKRGQYMNESFFDPDSTSCSTKTMLLFKTVLEALNDLSAKWNRDAAHDLNARFLGMDIIPTSTPDESKRLILLIKRSNLHGLGLEYIPVIPVHQIGEHFSVHLMTTGVKMLRQEYNYACTVWKVFDCDQISHFNLSREMAVYFPEKRSRFKEQFDQVVANRLRLALPIPFYEGNVIRFWGLLFVLLRNDLGDSYFISVLPKECDDVINTGIVNAMAARIFKIFMPDGNITLSVDHIKHVYMQDAVTMAQSGGWVLIILETLLEFITNNTKDESQIDTILNRFPSRVKDATNMHLNNANISGVMHNVSETFKMSREISSSIVKNVLLMNTKAKYATTMLKVGKGVGTALNVCSFYSNAEIKSTVAEIEKTDTSAVVRVQKASDVNSIVIADIAFDVDTKLVVYAGVMT